MKCEVKVTGISKIINRLNKLEKIEQPQYIKKILEKLAEKGIKVCDTVYQRYINQYREISTPVSYNLEWVSDTNLMICANGEEITFLEFGTGVHYNVPRDYPRATEMGMDIGGFGKGQGKNDHWFYPKGRNTNGIPSTKYPKLNISYGMPASKGMWEATKEIRARVEEVVREVLEI